MRIISRQECEFFIVYLLMPILEDDGRGFDVISWDKDDPSGFGLKIMQEPDVILMDIKMPGCDGIDALKLIKAQMPQIKVVMLTTSDEEEDLYNAFRFGASGYLLKSTNRGIREV